MRMQTRFDSTRLALALGVCLIGAFVGMAGCQNTAEGVKQDAEKDERVIRNVADKAVEDTKIAVDKAAVKTKGASSEAGDALSLTPKVKTAILAQPKLRDSRNRINVNTKDHVVHLEGHVISGGEKRLAGDVASKTVKEAGAGAKVMNQLTVGGH